MSARVSTLSSSSETEGTTVGVSGARHRQQSSTGSQSSALATGTPYDTVSIATTTNTGFTNATNVTANTSASQQQITGGGVPIIRPPVLEQRKQLSGTGTGVTNEPFQIDVVSSKQRGSSSSSGVTYLGQQPRAQTGNQTSGQFRYQQTQFANQISGQQLFYALPGADAFKDVVLNIDYGVIEAYNVGIQSAGDLTEGQLSGGFDAAKAIFKQADANQDGSISRDEFRQWAQGGLQNLNTQSYSNNQTTTNYGNNFNNATGSNPEIANILQQSGLAQAYGNY